jgi:transposase InsO family protein
MSPLDQKIQLIADWQSQIFDVTDLSQKYGISRPTVYKFIGRYTQIGVEGLKEQSRAPKNCPHRTPKKILDLIVQEKLKNRKRGPRKIRAQLKRQYPELNLPAVSTVSYWLKKEGLVEQRKKRRHVPAYTQPFSRCRAPNDVWSIDYKGQFYLKNGDLCYPLTITDNFSRFILGCSALPGPRYIPTRHCLEGIFREFGLPYAMRFDNGTPFASRCIGGLSPLMTWFILLGIIPERIAKGCPQENGRHERMHKTLKNDALDPIAKNLKDQQKSFDIYRHDFNFFRPHESLNDQTPSEYYKKSNRPYVEKPHPPVYEHDYLVRYVRQSGDIKLMGKMFFITESLAGFPVGLKEITDGIWQLQFSFYIIGSIDLRKNKIIRA